ncbi:DUF4123 domain-containing protein [Sorangium sp. So ce429]
MIERAAALLAREPTTLYALLDGARDRSISRRIRASELPSRSLYEGERGEELAPFGPYLIELPSAAQVVESWLREDWGNSHGVFLTSKESFAAVRRHLRRFLRVQLEDGREVYFRFYDPRVLRLFLPRCTYEEWIEFFGPVESYFAEAEDGHALLRFRRDADAPDPERMALAT